MTEEERYQEAGEDQTAAPAFPPGNPLPLPDDPRKAQEILNALPVRHQLDLVLQARGKQRLHTLFLSNHPVQLISQLPELEIFLTIKDIGERDCLDLISLTTPDQFQYLLDLDFWKKDELDPEKVLCWLGLLLECGEKKIFQFIRTAEPDFLVLLMKKFLRVKTLEGEPVEVKEGAPFFTLDEYYFIEFKSNDAKPILQPFLRLLHQIDGDLYRRLMESLIWELESELSEYGYRLRNNRLADYGFPDFEEALEIYRFVNPDTLMLEKEPAAKWGREETEKGRPTFYLTFQKEGPFFSDVLSRVEEPLEQNRVKEEIAALSNKAMIAEGIDLFKIDEMEKVTKKVFHYLNLGLQYLSQEEETEALRVLQTLPIQKIFQCGVSCTLLLRKRAEGLFMGSWFGGDRENLVFLDSPFLERFEGILLKRPRFSRNGIADDFRDLQDWRGMKNFLEFIEALTGFLEERLDLDPRRLKEMDLSDCSPGHWRTITFSSIFLTVLANQVLYGFSRFEAIERASLWDLFSRLFKRDEQGKGVIRMEMRDGLNAWLNSIEDDESRRKHLRAFQDFCLDLLEEQFGKFPSGEAVDPRFVRGLLIRE